MAKRKVSPRPKSKAARGRSRRRRRGFWSWLFGRIGRGIRRRARRRWQKIKGGVRKVFEPKVIKSHKRDAWKNQFPDPSKPKPFVMTKVDPKDNEAYEALFDGLLVVSFTASPRSNLKLADAAQEAAEAEHGPIAQSWVLTSIEGTNDAGREVLSCFPGGVFKP